jgi:flagellar biosynthetic protein FliR
LPWHASLVVATVGDKLPAPPASALGLCVLILGEVVVGAFLGAVMRMLMGSLEVAGTLIAQRAGLAAVNILNPSLASQGALPSALLGVVGVVAIFITDLHHLFIRAIVDSYATLVPGAALPAGDFSELAVRLAATSFRIGVQMAAPFLVVGLIFALGLGLLARLMPQLQVFFIAMPLQIALGIAMIALTLSAVMLFWLRSFEDVLRGFLAGAP